MTIFAVGHKYYPRTSEGLLAMRLKMSGDKNPAKRADVRLKIGIARKGNNGRKGIPHTLETKLKISLAHKGLKKPWAGKFITPEGRSRIRVAIRGSRNKWWKGGISTLYVAIRNLSEYRKWRTAIFNRDDYTCQLCGQRGGYLEADHYPKMRSTIMAEYKITSVQQALACEELWSINNGRTLCHGCHNTTKYGRPKRQLQLCS